jgi:ribosomal protein L37AE/L43A
MKKEYPILDIVELLGIPHKEICGDNFYCRCPLCGTKRFTLNVDIRRNIWRCNRCGKSGGSIGLYTLVTYNQPYDKSMRETVMPELERRLGLDSETPAIRKPRMLDTTIVRSQYPDISDYSLNILHQQLLNIPQLALNPTDRQSLLDRGLSEAQIEKNQYRSFRTDSVKNAVPASWPQKYEAEGWKSIQAQNPVLEKLTKWQLLTCLWVGQCLVDASLKPEGMAGAFKFRTPSGSYWGVRLMDGILIPIRNALGEIVALQVRSVRKKGGKYMLISSKNMPCGRIGKTRIHHPLANGEGNRKDSDTVLLTEGPLKADVYCHLAPDASHKVLALVGVNCTSQLKQELQEMHATTVFEAFDMDKLLNPSVLSAAKKIRQICTEEQYAFYNVFWDLETVQTLLAEAEALADKHGVELPEQFRVSPQLSLAYLTNEFSRRNLSVPQSLTEWKAQTKGIDDYAKTQSQLHR